MAKAVDLIGQRFGKLVVVERAENNHRGNTQWLCKCDCGKSKIALGYDLTHGRTVSCGCNLAGKVAHNRQNLTGQIFGKLTVLSIAESNNGKIKWKCRCSCGNETEVATGNLRNGHIQSCGCSRIKNYPTEDLVGERFGRLVVKGLSEYKKGRFYWKCECDCGNTKIVSDSRLKAEKIKSCGCFYKDNLNTEYVAEHGDSSKKSKHHRIYSEWRTMLDRCSPTYHQHHRYFDRGIRVCEDWKDYLFFKDWALNNGYSDELTLDRINNDGIYEPSNCRWATLKQQVNNKSDNVYISYQGKIQTLKQWSEELGLSYGMLKARHRKGWELDRLFLPNTKR